MAARDIAIVGMDCVLPGACNLAEYWNNLVQGVDAITEIPPGRLNGIGMLPRWHDWHITCTRGGFLPEAFRFEPLKFGVMPTIVSHGDPDQFVTLHVIHGALADAGIEDEDPLRRRTDVIVGRGGYITNKMSEVYYRADLANHLLDYLVRRFPELNDPEVRRRLLDDLRATIPRNDADNLSTCIPNLVASRVANRLNLLGAAYTVDAACASSLMAVEHAVTRLRQGACDAAVAAGIFLCQTPTFWTIFSELGALSRSQQIRPFDRRADGLLVGEGAGAVVLRRLDDARRDANPVYAVIKGVGVSSDGRATHVLNPASSGQSEALRKAYLDADVDPATIGCLEAHGTGTTAGDLAEIETIKRFYGRRGRFPPLKAVGSVKSMIGHTMPAAGIASLVKTVLSLSNKCLLPSLHCEEPHEAIRDTCFYVNSETRPWIQAGAGPPRRAGVNAFGFGGINVHVVLEEPDSASEPARRPIRRRPCDAGTRPSELIAFSAPSEEQLRRRLQKVERFLGSARQTVRLADVASRLVDELDFGHSHRLAFVCRDAAELERLVTACLERLSGDRPRLHDLDQVYYSSRASEPIGKVAGIFPGIGFPGLIGNYPDHLLELCRQFPEIREEFGKVELRDRHPEDPIPTSLIFSPPSSLEEELRRQLRQRIAAMTVIEGADREEPYIAPWQRNIAASGVTLGNWLCWCLLKNLQVPIDMACGQSQGEIAAMCAAGMLDIDDVIPRFWQALAVSPAYAGKGRLAFIGAGEEKIAPYLAESPDTAVAIHVAPEMVIIGGRDEHIMDVTQRLRQQGLIANPLPYPPIHTPRLRSMRDELKRIIDMNFRFRKPQFPVYSAITENPFPDDEDEIRELALDNLDRPVRFWQTIHRMYRDGARVFLQVGGGTMAANIKSILPQPDIVGTAVDVDYRDPVSQVHHMCAELLVCGIRFDLSYLHRYGRSQKTQWDAPPRQGATMTVPLRMDWVPVAPPPKSEQPEPAVASKPPVAPEPAVAPEPPGTPFDTATEPPPLEAVVASSRQGEDAQEAVAGMPEAVMPLVGRISHHVPRQEIVSERILDLDEDLFLHDHVLIDAGSEKPLESRIPILPLTMILEAAAETAALLVPGLGLIGFERITAFRWIDFHDARTLRLNVQCRLQSADAAEGVSQVHVVVHSDGRPSASLTVLFGRAYREDVKLRFSELTGRRAWPLTADQVYTERHMFHGRLFRCVTGLHVLGDQGLEGEITIAAKDGLFASLPSPHLLTDPVALDGVAQLVAIWAIVNGAFLMPAKIAKIELYGPTPPPGTKVPVRVEIRRMSNQQRTVTADAEVQDGSGGVWLRLQGINEWLYDYLPRLQDTHRLPTRFHVASVEQLPGAPDGSLVTLVTRSDLRHASLEWLARLFLHQVEWEWFRRLSVLQRKWQWLMGRIAAKDAVRLFLAGDAKGALIHPARLLIGVDEAGRPSVQPLEECPAMPQISIAHSEGLSIAMAAPVPCGIDAEPVLRNCEDSLSLFAGAGEIELIQSAARLQPREQWATRVWCAKEAVAKTLGSGLRGRPRDFETADVDVDRGGRVLIRHLPTASTYLVHTVRHGEMIVAYTSADHAGPEGTSAGPGSPSRQSSGKSV